MNYCSCLQNHDIITKHIVAAAYPQIALREVLHHIYDTYVAKLKESRYVMCNHGNLKGESVVAAILPSHMEVSYYTFGFFHS